MIEKPPQTITERPYLRDVDTEGQRMPSWAPMVKREARNAGNLSQADQLFLDDHLIRSRDFHN